MEATAATRGATPEVAETQWQNRLLPLMGGMLLFLTLFFCSSLAYETISVQRHIESAHEIDLSPLVQRLEKTAVADPEAALNEFRAKAQALLEANVIERRYHQASAAAIGRIYIVFLGFATGMVLALAGGAFILGKIKERDTSIEGAGPAFKAGLRSGSPGLVLAFFGTALMVCTILSRVEISVSDQALYLGAASQPPAFATGKAAETQAPAINQSPADILRNEVKPLLNQPKERTAK
jgi:hypothetical protein